RNSSRFQKTVSSVSRATRSSQLVQPLPSQLRFADRVRMIAASHLQEALMERERFEPKPATQTLDFRTQIKTLLQSTIEGEQTRTQQRAQFPRCQFIVGEQAPLAGGAFLQGREKQLPIGSFQRFKLPRVRGSHQRRMPPAFKRRHGSLTASLQNS